MNKGNVVIENKLRDYLHSFMPEADDLEVSNLSGVAFGASRETYIFDVSFREGGVKQTKSLVLRRDPPTGLLDHISRETEFRILKSLEGSGIPAPEVLCCESDTRFLDRPFIIMEKVDGLVTQAFQVLGRGNESLRKQIAEEFVAILARIHSLDWRLAGLDFLGVPEGPEDYAKKELSKWEEILDDVRLEPDPILTEALIWLKSNIRPAAETCLVHGDYKLDNVMYKENRIQAIFDWEMATLGDPHDDLGWVCTRYYEVDGLIQGLMKRDWFLSRYEEVSGRRVDPAALRFWQVFSNVKMAAITLTGAHRYISGKARKNVLAVLPLLMAKLNQDIIELLKL
jgi:aminoglycoside phosphotransferase (APT) family kinase protein